MKIKINIKSIIFMALIAIASLLFINISFAANTGKITTETARLRETPDTNAKVLELASQGEEVEILEEVEEWYKVKYKKITGYIRKDLIETDNKKENKTAENDANLTEKPETQQENKEENIVENQVGEQTTGTNAQPESEQTIEKGKKYKVSGNSKLKIIPLISAIELNEVSKDSEVEVVEILNNWVRVNTADGKQGWIKSDILVLEEKTTENTKPEETNKNEETKPEEKTETNTQKEENKAKEKQNTTKTMYVNSQTVNVRQKPDKTSKVIKQLSINEKVNVISSENGWANVDIAGTKGYIAENLLSSTKQETSRSATTERNNTPATNQASNTTESKKETTNATTPNTSTQNTTTTTSSSGSEVVSYAQQFIGCKYVYGGTTTKGFDCSGFTQFVYKHFGVNLNRTAAAQYSNGKAVTSLQAGDLVMFGKSGINHVGIYIGGNKFVHAANPSRGVTIDTLSTGYYKTNYVGARRIF